MTLDIAMDASPLVAGVELGGTKCVCTLGHGPGRIEEQVVLPTREPSETLPAIAAQLARWHEGLGFVALGIAGFGPLDLDQRSETFGHVRATAKPGWSGADMLGGIVGALRVPVRLDSDVNGAARAEQLWGGHATTRLAYVTVGTGIGVGFARADNLNPPDSHAELGHLRMVRHSDDRRASVCPFHADCAEGLASGRAIMARFDGSIDSNDLDDPRWAAPIDYLGQLCHAILSLGNVERIVFGGGAIIGNPALIAGADIATRSSVNGYLALPEAVPLLGLASLSDQAGPLGSLALALDALSARADVTH